ncbi:MAG: OmpA family protein [Treponema sp.]|nr:OmpA family protein [Candidatus Treponema equifaecale]
MDSGYDDYNFDDLPPVMDEEEPPVVATEVTVVEKKDGTIDIKIPNLSFKINSAALTSSASNQETINQVYDILNSEEYGDCNIIITGYVNPDRDTWSKAEKVLALNRAESVKQALVKKGISAARIGAEAGDGKTPNKEYNRRVDFKLYRGSPTPVDAK